MFSQKARPDYGEKPGFWSPGAHQSPGARYELPQLSEETRNVFPSVPYERIWCYPAVPPEQTSDPTAIPACLAQQNKTIALLHDVHMGTAASQQLLLGETQMEGQLSCVSVPVGSEVSTLPVAIFHHGK